MGKVFLSWSGVRSEAVATALRAWLPQVIQGTEVFLSSVDIGAGTRWGDRLAEELQETDTGIVCLTPENINSLWLQFEAGALSKAVGYSFVMPYLLSLSPTQVTGPLTQFQMSQTTYDGTRRIVGMINESRKGQALPSGVLEKQFERCWHEMEAMLVSIPDAPDTDVSVVRSEIDVLGEVLEHVRQQSRTLNEGNIRAISDMFSISESGVEIATDRALSIKAPIIKLN